MTSALNRRGLFGVALAAVAGWLAPKPATGDIVGTLEVIEGGAAFGPLPEIDPIADGYVELEIGPAEVGQGYVRRRSSLDGESWSAWSAWEPLPKPAPLGLVD